MWVASARVQIWVWVIFWGQCVSRHFPLGVEKRGLRIKEGGWYWKTMGVIQKQKEIKTGG